MTTTPYTFALTYREAMKVAKKLAHSMGKQETRYYLNGFFVHESEGKHYAVSTDGHTLSRVAISPEALTQDDTPFPAVIFPAAVKQIEAMKPPGKANAVVVFTVDGLNYSIACDGQSAGGRLIDATYPDYARVIPADYLGYSNDYGTCGFNPLYLAAVCKAASYDAGSLKANSFAAVRLHFQDGSPAVAVERDPAVLYVVMPIRDQFPEHRHEAPAADIAA